MTEDASSRDVPPVSLSLAPGRRIVTPGLDPVLGWIGAESARPPQPLILPPELLEPCATETIAYACNLPAVRHPAKKDQAPPVATPAGTEAFTASLPGGQVPVVLPGGEPGLVRFWWASLQRSANSVVWRCFLQLRTQTSTSAWAEMAHDYAFDGNGSLLNNPESLALAFGDFRLSLLHPEGKLTSFPCKSGRVKVTRLRADGWRKRELSALLLHPDRSIAARFSDGTQSVIATAAPPGEAIAA